MFRCFQPPTIWCTGTRCPVVAAASRPCPHAQKLGHWTGIFEEFHGDLIGFHGDFIGDLMVFNGDLIGLNGDLMGFNGDLMGFNGI